ncbi:MAG TPA: DNA polymerase III subunit gamma/tau [Acidobacteriota bacterium]|nr:DNA polymerase III subunit gamma/tau [Acidobacteriota bacterium]
MISYEPLARKCRPQTFEELVGQEAMVRALKNTLASGKVHPAYIFSGIRGVGKTTVARIFAKGLNCEKGVTPNPCNQCPSCLEITRSFSLDMLEIDGATHTGAEEARLLADMARYTPSRDRFRIFLIDEVHMLSKAAFNALLKTLEEPPPQAVFLFATTEPHKIPETIESRSHHFRLKRLTEEMVLGFLRQIVEKEKISIDEKALSIVARCGEGSMRDSLTILDRLISYAGLDRITDETASKALGIVGRDYLLKTARAVLFYDLKGLYALLGHLFERGDDPERFLLDLMRVFREILRARAVGEADEDIRQLVAKASMEEIMRALDLMVVAVQRLKQALDQRVVLELELTKIASLPQILPIDRILKSVEETDFRKSGQLLPLDGPAGNDEENSSPAAPPEPVREPSVAPLPEEGNLRFSALIPFKRMDEEESKSFEMEDERLENFKKEVVKELPLATEMIERSQLSIDPDGNLHIFVPKRNATVFDYLKIPGNARKLEAMAAAQNITGRVYIEKTNGEETDEQENAEARSAEKKEPRDTIREGTKKLIDAFEGRVVKLDRKENKFDAGGDDGESE